MSDLTSPGMPVPDGPHANGLRSTDPLTTGTAA